MSENEAHKPCHLSPEEWEQVVATLQTEAVHDFKSAYEKVRELPGLYLNGIGREHWGAYYRFAYLVMRDHCDLRDFETFQSQVVRLLGPKMYPYVGLLWLAVWRRDRRFFDEQEDAFPGVDVPQSHVDSFIDGEAHWSTMSSSPPPPLLVERAID